MDGDDGGPVRIRTPIPRFVAESPLPLNDGAALEGDAGFEPAFHA